MKAWTPWSTKPLGPAQTRQSSRSSTSGSQPINLCRLRFQTCKAPGPHNPRHLSSPVQGSYYYSGSAAAVQMVRCLPSEAGTFRRAKTVAALPSSAALPIHHLIAPSSGVLITHCRQQQHPSTSILYAAPSVLCLRCTYSTLHCLQSIAHLDSAHCPAAACHGNTPKADVAGELQ